MDRRHFIKTLEQASVVALCGTGLLAGCSSLVYLTPEVAGQRLVIPKADMLDYPFVLVRHPAAERPIYLHRHGVDDFTAVSTRCTHKGCQVEPAGTLLVCPCHGSEYTLEGTVVKSPAEQDLRPFPVTTDAEHIYIRM